MAGNASTVVSWQWRIAICVTYLALTFAAIGRTISVLGLAVWWLAGLGLAWWTGVGIAERDCRDE